MFRMMSWGRVWRVDLEDSMMFRTLTDEFSGTDFLGDLLEGTLQ